MDRIPNEIYKWFRGARVKKNGDRWDVIDDIPNFNNAHILFHAEHKPIYLEDYSLRNTKEESLDTWDDDTQTWME